jgi:hypothetical protein
MCFRIQNSEGFRDIIERCERDELINKRSSWRFERRRSLARFRYCLSINKPPNQAKETHSMSDPTRNLSIQRIQSERKSLSGLLPFAFLLILESRRLEVEGINIHWLQLWSH